MENFLNTLMTYMAHLFIAQIGQITTPSITFNFYMKEL